VPKQKQMPSLSGAQPTCTLQAPPRWLPARPILKLRRNPSPRLTEEAQPMARVDAAHQLQQPHPLPRPYQRQLQAAAPAVQAMVVVVRVVAHLDAHLASVRLT
jgi:hypothetical protein